MLVVPAGPGRTEIRVLNSRFVASLEYVATVPEARAFAGRIRAESPGANHHVPAWVIGGGASRTEYCSDDGEPPGTAGRPLLAVLRGSGFGNAVVVVTRYFGGTLLGTGGLVKAYSEAGRAVLAGAGRAVLVETATLGLTLPYALYTVFRRMVPDAGIIVLKEEFGETVSVTVELPFGEIDRFRALLGEASAGTVVPVRISTGFSRRPYGGAEPA